MKAKEVSDILADWVTTGGALHARLGTGLKQAIQQGNLLPGAKLPSERALARALAISRTTVLTAYNELRASGWLESRPGSGTWVNRAAAIGARARAQARILSRSPLLNLLLAEGSGAIDFGAATTAPLTTLPTAAFELPREQYRLIFNERSYMPFGFPALREKIASRYCQLGAKTTADQILITTGAQQAISLITALCVQRGDPVLVEDPAFFGALEAFRLAGARIAAMPVSSTHIAVNALRNRILTVSPRLLYLTPTFQNPTGATMNELSRQNFADLISEFEIPVIEDETLAEMVLEGSRPKPIAACGGRDNIFSIGSLSKLFCAGLRIGWIRGSTSQIARLARVKSAMDLGSPLLPQAIGAQLMNYLDEAVRLRQQELLPKRNLIEQVLAERLPEWTFTHPNGGLCIWARLPYGDAAAFAQVALRHGIVIAHGNLFSNTDAHSEYVRIPFLLDEESLKAGMERLGNAWQAMSHVAGDLPQTSAMIV